MRKVYQSPAKINPLLYVLGKRHDGYHDLAMLMQSVTLFDQITLTVEPGDSVRVVCPGVDLPDGARNIAADAARVLMDRAGQSFDVIIEIEKKYPGRGRTWWRIVKCCNSADRVERDVWICI